MPPSGAPTHIDDVSRSIADRVRTVCPDTDITFVSKFHDTDDSLPKNPAVELCFRAVFAEKSDRAIRDKSDSYLVRYDLRVRGPNPLENQRIFSEICFCEAGEDDFRVVLPSLSDKGDSALPSEPRLSVTARLTRQPIVDRSHIVTSPLGVELRQLGSVRGSVVSETGAPIMRAEIDAQSLGKRVFTDRRGRFVLPGAPEAGVVAMIVRARGKSLDISVDVATQSEIVIVMPMEETHA